MNFALFYDVIADAPSRKTQIPVDIALARLKLGYLFRVKCSALLIGGTLGGKLLCHSLELGL